MALQQGEVERLLRVEVPVENRLGDACGPCDLVEARVGVSALAEQAAGFLEDQLAALRSGQSLLSNGCDRGDVC
jgi:hypothetical protein